MNQSTLHETTPPREAAPEQPYINPQLEQLARIETGGVPRKVNMRHLPKWLRVFGYFLIAFLLVEMLLGIYSSLTH